LHGGHTSDPNVAESRRPRRTGTRPLCTRQDGCTPAVRPRGATPA
jgi:hypothetical protein